ncbi:hypothetical protein Bca52824_065131 [Brassica carinata]|uniref:Uncharacterized protein n=1 Tax=Brassica carinata TaxID=52824 RepID=A0A8X7UC41_BRACI|nr:hypothetical protein Bca52824_065131 [Brassica carinata]
MTFPSSSDEYDITSLLQAEGELYADEAESGYNLAEMVHYPPQPEADDGIPTTCYCGGEPVVATSYTRKDPGRRYFTCDNGFRATLGPTIFNHGTVRDQRGEVVQEIEFVEHSVDPAEADAYWVATCNVEEPPPEPWVPMMPFSERVVGRPSRYLLACYLCHWAEQWSRVA